MNALEDTPRLVTGLFEQLATRTGIRRFPFPRRAARQGKHDPSEAVAVMRVVPAGASALLRRNMLIYGLGGLIAPFVGIKLIDLVVHGVFGA